LMPQHLEAIAMRIRMVRFLA